MTKVSAFRWNEEAEKYIQKLEELETGRLGGYYEEIEKLINASKQCNKSTYDAMIRLNEVRRKIK